MNATGIVAGGDVGISMRNNGDSDINTTVGLTAYQYNRNGGKIVFGRENANSWFSASGYADGFISFNPVLDGQNIERMRITSTGNVGIGTTSPGALLDIRGTSLNDHLRIKPTNDYHAYFIMDAGNGTNNRNAITIMRQNGADRWYYGMNGTAQDFRVYNYERSALDLAILNSNGNVGIGTTSPGSKLSVVGLPGYASDSAAGTGGLSVGDFYQTSGHATLPDGVLMVKQ